MSGAGLPSIVVPDCTGMRIGVVTSHWNEEITGQLRANAIAAAEQAGAEVVDVQVVGALEIPVVAQELAQQCDAVVALGCVIRGGTPHFDFVCDSVTAGLTRLTLDAGIAIGNGVLTTNTLEQAVDRSGAHGSAEDKGRDAMVAALHTAHLLKTLRNK